MKPTHDVEREQLTIKRHSANIVTGCVLAFGAAVASTATAAADPPPDVPADPAPPPGPSVPLIGAPLGPNGLSVLAQNGAPAAPGSLGVPAGLDVSPGGLLGQNPVPAVPGGPPGTPPNLSIFNNAYALPQNEVPSAPSQGTEVGVAPGDENANISRLDWLKQWHQLYSNGNLKGALLGQLPQEQLGEPLPGTAPPPGTNTPPGLVQNLPDSPPAIPAAPPTVLPAAPPAG